MKIRGVITIFVYVILNLLLLGCINRDKAVDKHNKKPNIIYILADDLGYGDLSCYGQEKFKTPNIDKLATGGMQFTQHYAGSPVCSPSRSTLLTGQHTGHTPIRGNQGVPPEGQFPLDSSVITVAKLLKKAGYVTGAYGKWGLGYPGSEGEPNNQGFDEFYGYNCQTLAHNYYPYFLRNNREKEVLELNQGKQTGTYAPEIIHDKAMAFIEKNKDTAFFVYYPSVIPHAELAAPEKYMERFRGKFLPEREFKGVDDGERYKKGGYASQKEAHAAFVAMITILDEQVGDIIMKLKELGIADNTIILFSSDNGPHWEGGAHPVYFNSNGPLKGYKRDVYEGGVRVPMIAYWPGKIASGSVSDHISAFWDFLPTACDLAQISKPENIDGISFLPTLLGSDEQETHKSLYWEFYEQKGKQAVRYGAWKGVRLNMDTNPDAPIELYNLTDDIGEEHDVSSEHPEIVEEIRHIMEQEHVYNKDFNFSYEKK